MSVAKGDDERGDCADACVKARLFKKGLYGAASTLALGFFSAYSLCVPRLRQSLAERCLFSGWKGVREAKLWIHGASAGEVTGIRPVLNRILEQGVKAEDVLITTTTPVGLQAVRSWKSGVQTVLLPFDHPQLMKRALAKVNPRVFLLAETELWPALLLSLAERNVPLLIFNGRISDYSWPKYRRLRWVLAPLLRTVNACMVQNKEDAERFANLGVRTSAIEVTGSTKYDFQSAPISLEDKKRALVELGMNPDASCIVAGSVRPGEDDQVISAFVRLRESWKGSSALPQLIIAPRHKERFDAVASLLLQRGVVFSRRSAQNGKNEVGVLLLDTFGELGLAYRAASVAFVGATLVDIGGHNPFEPASCGVPVIVGPYVRNIKNEVAALEAGRGLMQVHSGEELQSVLENLLNNEVARQEMGDFARKVWLLNQGSTIKVCSRLWTVLIKQGVYRESITDEAAAN